MPPEREEEIARDAAVMWESLGALARQVIHYSDACYGARHEMCADGMCECPCHPPVEARE